MTTMTTMTTTTKSSVSPVYERGVFATKTHLSNLLSLLSLSNSHSTLNNEKCIKNNLEFIMGKEYPIDSDTTTTIIDRGSHKEGENEESFAKLEFHNSKKNISAKGYLYIKTLNNGDVEAKFALDNLSVINKKNNIFDIFKNLLKKVFRKVIGDETKINLIDTNFELIEEKINQIQTKKQNVNLEIELSGHYKESNLLIKFNSLKETIENLEKNVHEKIIRALYLNENSQLDSMKKFQDGSVLLEEYLHNQINNLEHELESALKDQVTNYELQKLNNEIKDLRKILADKIARLKLIIENKDLKNLINYSALHFIKTKKTLKRDLNACHEEINFLHSMLDNYSKRINQGGDIIERMFAEIEELTRENKILQNLLMPGQVSETEEKKITQNNNNQISELQEELNDENDAVELLKKDLEKFKSEIESLKFTLEGKMKEIFSINNLPEDLTEKLNLEQEEEFIKLINDCFIQIKIKLDSISVLEEKLVERQENVKKLQSELAEKNKPTH